MIGKKQAIKSVIPAGITEQFTYSEEISPNDHKLKLSAGNGLGDTEVALKMINKREQDV